MSTCSKRYRKIPDGSKLTLKIETDLSDVLFAASWDAGTSRTHLNNNQLFNKTLTRTLTATNLYVFTLVAVFIVEGSATGTVTVTSTIIKPDGVMHSNKKTCTFTGSESDAAHSASFRFRMLG